MSRVSRIPDETVVFPNRTAAGEALAERLKVYKNRSGLIVLGIPRGGVPVAFEVAAALHAPLDVFVVRKLGVPWQKELAFGAIASGGIRLLDSEVVEGLGISERDIEVIAAEEKKELDRREQTYRGAKPPLNVAGMTVILVDDGIATGSSMRAAIAALRQLEPAWLVVAVPVAPASTCRRLQTQVDEFVCVQMPESFLAIGQFYDDFSQVSDETVADLLRRASRSDVASATSQDERQEGGFTHDFWTGR
jgi:putative phosphoribosyl transferase